MYRELNVYCNINFITQQRLEAVTSAEALRRDMRSAFWCVIILIIISVWFLCLYCFLFRHNPTFYPVIHQNHQQVDIGFNFSFHVLRRLLIVTQWWIHPTLVWGIRIIIIHFSLLPASHTELVPIFVFNLPVIKFSETTNDMSSLPKLRCITHTGTKFVWLWCFEHPVVLVEYLNLFDVFKLWFSSLPFSLFSQTDGWVLPFIYSVDMQ